MLLLDAGLLAVLLLRWRQLLAVCFDPEFAGLRGLSVEGYTLLLLTLTAVTVVLLVTVVGLVMVIALLTLPAAAAGRATGRLHCMMAVAGLLTLACTVSGLAISYGADLPGGATTVLLAAGLYLLSLLVPKRRRKPVRG
jgi:zinc transport system permease protein